LSKFHPQRLLTSELHNFLEVNFEDGLLYWKKRDESYFSSKRSCSVWNSKHAGKIALNANHKDGYKHGLIFSKHYLAHRVLYAMKYGEWPNFIDHINGIRSDNKLSNLRSVTQKENSCNSKKPENNTSGYIGVSWNKRDQRWASYITINKKRKSLGNFVNIDDAIICRKQNEIALGFHQNHGR
jgi:hypothetical protein